ncbi:MAG: glycosyltransferase family 4 protein [Candidatus Gastranaerophilales bacterium]|nr:glycosyltransferase family 4 protein [Candidatus Gastranaerophilales bacterium]
MTKNIKEYAGKVLIIVENLPVPFDTRVWQESKALTEAGYKVSIICPQGKGFEKKFECIDNISIYRHPMPKEGSDFLGYLNEYLTAFVFEFYLSLKVLFKEGFDVIHACNPPDNIFLIAAFYKLFGKKFVFDHHDICPELYLCKFNKKNILYYVLLLLEKLTFKFADISIATNESYKEIAIKRSKMDPDKVFVVRSGPDLSRLIIFPPNISIKRGKKYLVSYIGVIGKQEGLDYLIEAAKYIKDVKTRNEIQYSIIGDGPYLNEIKQKCILYGLDDVFDFTGRVSDAEMLKILNTADICVNPDEYNDMNDKSTMNKVLEYMALGKPIVQFELKEGRCSAQDSSLYSNKNDSADFAEKILFLLDNEELRTQMGQIGRKRIEELLCWDKSKLELIKAYNFLFEHIKDNP